MLTAVLFFPAVNTLEASLWRQMMHLVSDMMHPGKSRCSEYSPDITVHQRALMAPSGKIKCHGTTLSMPPVIHLSLSLPPGLPLTLQARPYTHSHIRTRAQKFLEPLFMRRTEVRAVQYKWSDTVPASTSLSMKSYFRANRIALSCNVFYNILNPIKDESWNKHQLELRARAM